jgi:phosphinothricin acetyltransferase
MDASGGTLRPVRPGDAAAICGIYNPYIDTVITFEEAPVSPEAMEGRIHEVTARYPWVVWEEQGAVRGYAYLHRWHERSAYRYSAEDSIYLQRGWEGKGIGERLLSRLLEDLRQSEIRAVIAAITIPNPGSIGLHEKLGFRKVAHFSEVGYKQGQWLDVGYWQCIRQGTSNNAAL